MILTLKSVVGNRSVRLRLYELCGQTGQRNPDSIHSRLPRVISHPIFNLNQSDH